MKGQKKPGFKELRESLIGLICALTALGVLGGCSYVSGLNARSPAASLAITPAHVRPGYAAILRWQTSDADQVVIEPGLVSVEASGNLEIRSAETLDYTITPPAALGVR